MLRSKKYGDAFGVSRANAHLIKATVVLILSMLMSFCFGQKVSSISLSESSLTGGGKAIATVTLSAKATGTGVTVNLFDSSGLTTMPTKLTIPGGQASSTFTIATYPVKVDTSATISAAIQTQSKSAKLLIKAPVLASVSLSPTSVTGGTSVTGTVNLTGSAPSGGILVSLKSGNVVAGIPATVTVNEQASFGTFTITTQSVSTLMSVTITGKAGSISESATLKINPAAIQSLVFSPAKVVSGGSATGTITLTGPAPAGDAKILLTSGSKVAIVPTSVAVSHGTSSATFSVQTSSVSVDTPCKITAKAGGSSVVQTLTVQKVGISSFAISPTTVQGGTTATGTITLNGKVGTAGFVVKLKSDQTFVTVPATETIGAGQTSATVTITSSKVTAAGVATITVTDPSGVNFTGTLKVNPAGAGLANSAWPKFLHDGTNSGLGTGKGASGTVKWKFATQGGIASSPAIGPDGTVYFGSNDNNFYAVDGTTGKLKWKYATLGTVNSSPTVSADGIVYFGGWDGNFYALDASTGKLKWTSPVNSYVSSGVALAKDGTVIFGCADHNVYALNTSDGTQKWSYTTGAEVVSTPAIGPDGTVYVGSNDMYMYALNGATGLALWGFKTNGSVVTSPVLTSSGLVCFGSYDSNFYALDEKSGAKVWEYKLTREIVSSAAIGADGTIYFGCNDSNFYALSPTGLLAWHESAEGQMLASPAIGGDGTIYITGLNGLLYAVPSTGKAAIWTVQLGKYSSSSVAIGSDGTLYVGSSDNNLYAIN